MNKKAFTINCHAEFISASHEIPKQVRNDSKRVAFTLAEVLITLTIIGVIAAITIPNLMKKWEDQHTISAVKEAYSILDNAIKQLIRNEGELTELNWPSKNNSNRTANNNYLLNQLEPYLKLAKKCGSISGCMPQSHKGASGYYYYKTLKGNSNIIYTEASNSGDGKALLANGMNMLINISQNPTTGYYPQANHNTGYIGTFRIDINGNKGPNRLGYDVFYFSFNKDGLCDKCDPYRNDGRGNGNARFANCSIVNNSTYATYDGYSCSTYVRLKDSVDYKYRDITGDLGRWPN